MLSFMIFIMNYFQTSLQPYPLSQAPNLCVWILTKYTHLQTFRPHVQNGTGLPFHNLSLCIKAHHKFPGQANRNQSPPNSLFLTSHVRWPTCSTSTKIYSQSVAFLFWSTCSWTSTSASSWSPKHSLSLLLGSYGILPTEDHLKSLKKPSMQIS